MGIAWIDRIYNRSDSTWYVKSVDDRHHGKLTSDDAKEAFDLSDKAFHALKPNTNYAAEWCAIPWYFRGDHYLVLTTDAKNKPGIAVYTSEVGGENFIVYESIATGKQILRLNAPTGSDFHCYLRILSTEEGEEYFLFEVRNNHNFSGENAVWMVYDESKGWVSLGAKAIAGIGGLVTTIVGAVAVAAS